VGRRGTGEGEEERRGRRRDVVGRGGWDGVRIGGRGGNSWSGDGLGSRGRLVCCGIGLKATGAEQLGGKVVVGCNAQQSQIVEVN